MVEQKSLCFHLLLCFLQIIHMKKIMFYRCSPGIYIQDYTHVIERMGTKKNLVTYASMKLYIYFYMCVCLCVCK